MKLPGYMSVVARSLAVLLAAGSCSAHAQVAGTNIPASTTVARDLGRADLSEEINVTVYLNGNNAAAFDRAVEALYDPASPTYHAWMNNDELKKYAATEAQQEAVAQELLNNGLRVVSRDPLGFSIRARGTTANVEKAFNTELHNFQHNGKVFRANVKTARLNSPAGDYVSTVAGLQSNTVVPLVARALDPQGNPVYASVPLSQQAAGSFPQMSTTDCLSSAGTFNLKSTDGSTSAAYVGTQFLNSGICDYLPSQLQDVLGLRDAYAAGFTGTGQTIVLVEAFGYPTLVDDANAFFTMANLPLLDSSNFKIVYPQGVPTNPNLGILTGWNTEMALDLEWAHVVAPGAKIVVVVTNGQDSESFENSITYVAEHDLGKVISNSYEEDIDLIAGPLEQNSWDQAIKLAAAKGMSVNFSTGDSGDHGLGTPLGAASVPSVSPHATSVGGTTILNDVFNPGSTITTSWGEVVTFLGGVDSNNNEVVFDPPTQIVSIFPGGGGGESVFWPKPKWQASLPGTGRQTPDVSALSNPFTGVPIVITFGTQQFIEYGVGGTSLACPIFSGFWALANQKAGHALGNAAPLIAALPPGGVQDVLPTTDSSPQNAAGTIVDQNGTTSFSASQLFGPFLDGNSGFTSTILSHPSNFSDIAIEIGLNGQLTSFTGTTFAFAFGIDSSLTVGKGWDPATGWGTPFGLAFLDAVTRKH